MLGRLINPDNTMGIIGNSISHNMYAYALNNPVSNFLDPFSGTLSMSFIFGVITIIVVFILLWTLYVMMNFTMWHSNFMSAISALGSAVSNIFAARTWGEQLMNKVRVANDLYRFQRTPYHNHHIVAQGAAAAEPARHIFLIYFGNINHPINLIPIRASLHVRMHTTIYYNTVNNLLIVANGGSIFNTNRLQTVNLAMHHMRAALSFASSMSP